MDIANEGRRILKKLGYDNVEFDVNRQRHHFPEGAMSIKGDKPPLIQFRGNEPSLARLGLALFIAHELAHVEYRKKNEPHPEEDFQPEFQKIERGFIEKVWDLCLEMNGD